MNNQKGSALLLFLPVVVLTFLGYWWSRPQPPVPNDETHICAAIVAQITNEMKGKTWIFPRQGNLSFRSYHISYARLSKKRGRLFVRYELRYDLFIPKQAQPCQYTSAREIFFHRDSTGVFKGNILIDQYGTIPVEVATFHNS